MDLDTYSPLAVSRSFALARGHSHGWAGCHYDPDTGVYTPPTTFAEAQAAYDAEQARREQRERHDWRDDVGEAPSPAHVTASGRASWGVASDGTTTCAVWSPRPEWVRREAVATEGFPRNERPEGDKGICRARLVLTPAGVCDVTIYEGAASRHLNYLADMAGYLGLDTVRASLRADAERRTTPAEWVEAAMLDRPGWDWLRLIDVAELTLPALLGAAQTPCDGWHADARARREALVSVLSAAILEARPLTAEDLAAVAAVVDRRLAVESGEEEFEDE